MSTPENWHHSSSATPAADRVGSVRIKQCCTHLLKDNLDRIHVLFAACLEQEFEEEEYTEDLCYVKFGVHLAAPLGGPRRQPGPDFITRLQKYVDDICTEGCVRSAAAGDDSSYDSDYELDPPPASSSSADSHHHHHQQQQQQQQHDNVSRTTSDTLAAEYADYVQTDGVASGSAAAAAASGYTARVEFALKLGYTERLVQAALHKLGPSPAQNELLAELIKLGAQRGGGGGGGVAGGGRPTPEGGGGQGEQVAAQARALRHVVVDGSNVAMSHGNKEIFSCRGIKLCVDWFKSRGHKEITIFVPKWRKEAPRPDNPVRDQDVLAELEKERLLVFTPSRLVGGKRMVCYDDRYILKLAAETDGIVVSNDTYRDLAQENPEFRKVIDERILMYSFVNDRFMPPDDPLGRTGPTLDNFLRTQPKKGVVDPPPPPCPYAKKCTYGNKCKYHHPERGPLPHKTVTERLSEHAQRHLQAREKTPLSRTRSNVPPPKDGGACHSVVSKSHSVDNVGSCNLSYGDNLHKKLQRQLTINPNEARVLAYVSSPQQPHGSQYMVPWQQQHQNVTRIASAPDSYYYNNNGKPTWLPAPQQQRHMQRLSSCSDPQLWPPPPMWAGPQHQHDEARRKMHYHLAAIFPEEQVTQAMQMYPDETNAQKICAAILSLFPKSAT